MFSGGLPEVFLFFDVVQFFSKLALDFKSGALQLPFSGHAISFVRLPVARLPVYHAFIFPQAAFAPDKKSLRVPGRLVLEL